MQGCGPAHGTFGMTAWVREGTPAEGQSIIMVRKAVAMWHAAQPSWTERALGPAGWHTVLRGSSARTHSARTKGAGATGLKTSEGVGRASIDPRRSAERVVTGLRPRPTAGRAIELIAGQAEAAAMAEDARRLIGEMLRRKGHLCFEVDILPCALAVLVLNRLPFHPSHASPPPLGRPLSDCIRRPLPPEVPVVIPNHD